MSHFKKSIADAIAFEKKSKSGKKLFTGYKFDPEILEEISSQTEQQSIRQKKKVSEAAVVRAAIRIGLGMKIK